MKILKCLLALALTCAPAWAGTIPITGTLRQVNGSLFNGKLRMTLSYSPARDTSANNLVVAQTLEFPIVNGTLPTNARITPNDVLQPANTFYTAEYLSTTGALISRNVFYVAGATFSISQATPTPLTTSNISFDNFTGLSSVEAKKIGNVYNASEYAGTTASAKIAAAIGAGPSIGVTVSAAGLEGAQSWATCPFTGVSKPVTLIVGASTSAISVDCTVPSNVTLDLGQGAILSPTTGKTLTIAGAVSGSLSQHFAGAGAVQFSNGFTGELYLEWFGGRGDNATDNAAAYAAAYAAAPTQGVVLRHFSGVYKVGSPVSFETLYKPIMLVGTPGGGTTIGYTPTTGTLFLFNYGNDNVLAGCCQQGGGIRDINLLGAGSGNATKAVVFGGTNGALGFSMKDWRITDFGTGLEMGDHTWHVLFSHGLMRNNNQHLNMPQAATEGGNDMVFDHIEFAEAATQASAIWIKGSQQEVQFINCTFGPQLHIGNSTSTFAQVSMINPHFENNPAVSNYDMIQMDNHNGNYLRIVAGYFVQTKLSAGPTKFMTADGGATVIYGFGMYSDGGSPLTNFASVNNAANFSIYDFNELSGNMSSNLITGNTTGYVVNFSGANSGSSTPRAFTIGTPGTASAFSFKGSITASTVLASQVATGTPPISVNSTTPATNLHARAVAYNTTGTQQVGTYIVTGSVTLSGGTAVVTLTGASAAYSGYVCTANDETAASAIRVQVGAPTTPQITFSTPTSTSDVVKFICIGS